MKNFTFTTLIALLLSPTTFSQTQREAGTNASATRTVSQAPDSRLMLLSPADGKTFISTEGNKPVLFRWTAVVPKPKEPVTYRLRVWQLMQGQNSTEAMRTNQPVITKDMVNITQTAISNLYTGPCKPPYLCDFIWAVEVLLTEDNTAVKNYGTAVTYTFRFEESIKADTGYKYKTYQPGRPVFGNAAQPATPVGNTNTDQLRLLSPADRKNFSSTEGAKPVLFSWTAVSQKPGEQVTYRIKVWQLMQGQSGVEAMRSNQPVVTKDLANITQTTISNLYNGPCKPPYLCDFIWAIEVLNPDGKPANRISDPHTFKYVQGIGTVTGSGGATVD